MRMLIETFPEQLNEAYSIGVKAKLNKPKNEIQNVLIAGLGGSGIGGKIISQLVSLDASLPISTVNDYDLPGWVNEHTLVIISSYSGNTEETISVLEQAIQQNAEIACITSGGKVLETAEKHNLNCIKIPGGNPPRSQFGYSSLQQLFLLSFYGVIPSSYLESIELLGDFLEAHQPGIIQEAEELVAGINGKFPILYAGSQFEGVAIRWRQQLNENSKILCWHHVFPELNHNELVGWEGGTKDLAVVLLRSDFDHHRTSKRMDISLKMIDDKTPHIFEIEAKGTSLIEQAYYLIHLGDWVSLIHAEKNNVDPIAIQAIDHLKSSLAEFK